MEVLIFDKKDGQRIGPYVCAASMVWAQYTIKEQEALGFYVEVHRAPGKTGKPGKIVYSTPPRT